ncbi:MAG: cryptochrome/photolyase family protein [Pseudomonadota bacterium]|nr:cryptochrome/photolyase family protein [Pseudomonadota bacterium]
MTETSTLTSEQTSSKNQGKTLCLILGDQLSKDISSLQYAKDNGIAKGSIIVLMAEVAAEAQYVKHHKKKIAFLFSAMRHFAQQLKEQGYTVEYCQYEQGLKSLKAAVEYAQSRYELGEIVVTEPGEYRLKAEFEGWQNDVDLPVKLCTDQRFLTDTSFFAQWAKGRKQLRMEYFYREMRKRHHVLMEDGEPVGGQWNFDKSNRQALPEDIDITAPKIFTPDSISQEVMALVEKEFADHFGALEPFYFAVTREQALQVLDEFIENRLPWFGDYQDAMSEQDPWLFHSHISFYLNCGLLNPQEVIDLAEHAYHIGHARINAVEGFIRQVLGWREYVRGLYWHLMPDYAQNNALNAKRDLPEFFWTAKTEMNCLKHCVQNTIDNAYAHHIQRLMVLGNFMLLAGIEPKQVNEWYLLVYADAYEWVELPNVSGMILFADGGILASKPYAASGSYIHKMSNYCQSCHYNVKEKQGATACPFNYLYWNFIFEHQSMLSKNPRMNLVIRNAQKTSNDKREQIKRDSQIFFKALASGETV